MGTGYGRLKVQTHTDRFGRATTTGSIDVQDDDPMVRSYFEQAMAGAMDGIGQAQVRTCGQLTERQMQNDFERVERTNRLNSNSWYGACNSWLGNSCDSDLSFDTYSDYCNNQLGCTMSRSELNAQYRLEKDRIRATNRYLRNR